MKSNNSPLITVAMVTYNSSKYLREAIDSVLESTYSNFELVISDDNSQDNTWEIITSYKNKHIRAFRNETNIGEYNNRNKCLHFAKGKYIIYIDGDDKIYSHALDFFVKYLEQNQNCACAISRPHDSRFFYSKVLNPEELYKLHYFSQTVLNLALVRVCFNTSILKNVGGFSTKYKAGDDFIRLQVAKKHPILIINDGLVWWRQTPGQASERLKKSINGCLEPFIINNYFLNIKDCPLDHGKILLARKKLKLKKIKYAFHFLMQGKILRFYKLFCLHL